MIEPLAIDTLDWSHIHERMDRLWVPEQNNTVSIIGLTGAGKSYLMRHGLMPMLTWDKVLIIDVKGDDPTLRGLGKAVKHLPTWQRTVQEALIRREPRDNWYRLVVHEDWATGRAQVRTALNRVWREKNWFVVIDELRGLVDTDPDIGLGLKGMWARMIMRGRSKGISTINMTQEPSWVPGLFYTQASFVFVGQVEDDRSHKRISEIGAHRGMLPHLPTIRKRSWLYTDNLEDQRFFAFTGLTASTRARLTSPGVV